LLTEKSYEIKISEFKKYQELSSSINLKNNSLIIKVDYLIKEVSEKLYLSLNSNELNNIINELEESKKLAFEKMEAIYSDLKLKLTNDELKIRSRYAGGIVFFIDNTGKHGLVCTESTIGSGHACWGTKGLINANGNGIADGTGMENTKKIVQYASCEIEKGYFSTKKNPIKTAARVCMELNHGGFNDWYLPTNNELDLLKQNLSRFEFDFEKDWIHCWSSTEANADKAYINGNKYIKDKNELERVVAIRKF